MRLGLLGDVHANLPALEAALAELEACGVDGYVCTGDLVGYGPQPNECVARVAALDGVCVAGNHDLIALGELTADRCIPLARDSLAWTRTVLDEAAVGRLRALPRRASGPGGLVVAHGSLADPQQYVRTGREAVAQLHEATEAEIVVLGHTHSPLAVGERRGTLLAGTDGRVALDAGERHVLNPGSVGQSRERRAWARVAVLDLDLREVVFRRFSYDERACRAQLRRRGRPAHSCHLPPRRVRAFAGGVLAAGRALASSRRVGSRAVRTGPPDAAARLALEPVDDLASLRDPWRELAERTGNVFATWEWASVWWRHYGARAEARPLVCRDEAGNVVAILPLCVERTGPLRVARFVGHGAGDELGPVCAPEDLPRVAAALRDASGPWDVMLAERLPGSLPWASTLGGRMLQREPSPIVETAGLDWDAYLASRSSNFRSQVRRKERKLVREHGLSYRLCDDPERLPGDMETLFDLHRRRWAEGGSDAFEGTRAAFHRDFAAVALERGWLRLWLAEIDGRAVAAWHGFRYGGSEWYYQFGRDPEWDRSSIGLVLLAHTLREAIGDGAERYRLLRGAESYKDRFATADPGLVTVASARRRSTRGALAVGGAAIALRLPARARRRVTARLG